MSLKIFAKYSILDIWQGSDYASEDIASIATGKKSLEI